MTDIEKNTNKSKFTKLPSSTTIEPQTSNENFSKTDITSVESHDLVDHREEVELECKNYFESVFNLTEPLNANSIDNNEKNDRIPNDLTLTKEMVISAVECFITELNNEIKVESTTTLRSEVEETHKEDVQTNVTALRSEVTNENRSKNVITSKILHDLENRREEGMELESENFKSILNLTTPLSANNNTENIINDDEILTKDGVTSAIDSLLIDMNNDVKMELITPPRTEIKRTHREGVRMNTTALRREMHIKKRLQNNKNK
ncbi:uncharacterized protein LOC100572040 [Acyrthosiphon pisum]|uniref:Uncharacterized protein n=1 Tax=Acyrthosiphon pisum TaxID=7029 RepID=A0A8R2FAT6_ACYPI|nr:uncharacterized protein LOC100572040 [Acyrthosiphon pisum]|eukprot:XP_008184128.1 PREDICTED: uncharacterized protein LOC100572040 [Acyrthosiphon pisum]